MATNTGRRIRSLQIDVVLVLSTAAWVSGMLINRLERLA